MAEEALPVKALPVKNAVNYGHEYPMPWHVPVLRFIAHFLLLTGITTFCLLPLAVVLLSGRWTIYGYLGPTGSKAINDFGQLLLLYTLLAPPICAILYGLVSDLFQHQTRIVLNRFALNPTNRDKIPARWQHNTLTAQVASGLACVSLLGAICGAIALLVGFGLAFSHGSRFAGSGALIVLLGLALIISGFFGVRFGWRATRGPAADAWAQLNPEIHPREPPLMTTTFYPDEGLPEHWKEPNFEDREYLTSRAQELAATTPQIRKLVNLANWVKFIPWIGIIGFFLTCGYLFLISMMERPCRRCDYENFSPEGSTLLDFLAINIGPALVGYTILTLIGLGLKALIHLKLRNAILALASQPDSVSPPWFILREFILEEAPMASVTQYLHPIGTVFLTLGLAYQGTQNSYLQYVLGANFGSLTTLGAMLLVSYGSCWFWERKKTAELAAWLKQRWPK